MKRLTVVLCLVLFTLCGASAASAYQATFDMTYITSMDLSPSDPDAWVVAIDETNEEDIYGEMHYYCQGVVKFKNKQEVGGSIVEDVAYGYFAAEIDDDETCANLVDEPENRPALLYLHHYGGHGSLDMAKFFARETGALAVSISAPGQSVACSTNCSSLDECGLEYPGCTGTVLDQASNGDAMSSSEIVEGFSASDTTQHPEYSMFYGYAHSAMRAITMIKTLFDVDGSDDTLGYTNGSLVLAGISGGGITSLIVNGVDSRADGVVSVSGMGGFKKAAVLDGNWLALLVTDGDYTTIDCDTTPTGIRGQFCKVADYMDPTNYSQYSPVMLINGAQDEFFPIPAFRQTRNRFINYATTDVFSFLVPDIDHKWYLIPDSTIQNECAEAFPNYGTTNSLMGVTAIVNNIVAFFQKVVHDDVDGLGDQTPQTTLTVTGSTIRYYKTWTAFDSSTLLASSTRVGYSTTDFWHVYPGLLSNGDPSEADIIAMTANQTGCPTDHTCFQQTTWLLSDPEYYGSFARADYEHDNYDGYNLAWHLTGDVVSGGTSGYNASTFLPDIRYHRYINNGYYCFGYWEFSGDDGEEIEEAMLAAL